MLTFEDYHMVINDNIHFARKFDTAQYEKVFDMLDARILQDDQKQITEL